MALIDRFKERISTSLLNTYTNPDDADETASNDTFLTRVCDDVEGEFVAWMGEAYDETVRVLILAAVQLVKLKLVEYGCAPSVSYDKAYDKVEKRLEKYRNVRSRDRVEPTSSSLLTPTEEVTGSEEVRPKFDDREFTDVIPDAPTGDTLD